MEPHEEPALTYRLAIFDFDGTLADTFGWFSRTVEEVGRRWGLDPQARPPLEEMRRLSAREVIETLRIPDWKLPLVARDMRRRAALAAGEMRLFEGVEEMLARLDEGGIALALVSSNGEEAVRGALGPRNAARFRHFSCGAAIFGKASAFRRTVRRVGAAPAICIGDELRDAEAARAAGLAFGAVAWGFTDGDTLEARARPDYLFTSVSEIAERLAPTAAAQVTGAGVTGAR